MKDILTKAITKDGFFKISAVTSTGIVNKAFGNLTYDKSLSYPDFKPEFGLEESIVLSET